MDQIESHLDPESIELLFQDGAIESAVELLRGSEALRTKAIHAAELARQRSAHGVDVPTLPLKPGWEPHQWDSKVDAARSSYLRVVMWAAVAPLLLPQLDLLSKLTEKSAARLSEENALLNTWSVLFELLSREEWMAIEGVLKVFLLRRGSPVATMVERLRGDSGWQDYYATEEEQADLDKLILSVT